MVLATFVAVPAAWAQQRLYVANGAEGTISVVDVDTMTVVDTIDVGGGGPWGVAITPDGGKLYVADSFWGDVIVIDTATHAIDEVIHLGIGEAVQIAITPDGTEAWVAGAWGQTVKIIDTTTNTLDDTIEGGFSGGISLIMDGSGERAYLTTDAGSVAVFDIDTHAVIDAGIPAGSHAYLSAPNAAGSRVYVSRTAPNMVAVIDTSINAVIDQIPLGPEGSGFPTGLAVSPDQDKLYVATLFNLSAAVVDLASHSVDHVPLATSGVCGTELCYGDVVFTHEGARVFVSAYSTAGGESLVHVIDATTATEIATIPVGLGPIGMAISPPPDEPDPEPDFDVLAGIKRLQLHVKWLIWTGKVSPLRGLLLYTQLRVAEVAYERGWTSLAEASMVRFRRTVRYFMHHDYLREEYGRPLVRAATVIIQHIE